MKKLEDRAMTRVKKTAVNAATWSAAEILERLLTELAPVMNVDAVDAEMLVAIKTAYWKATIDIVHLSALARD